MTPIRLAGPTVEPVGLPEMRAYLRFDSDDGGSEDGLVQALVAAARAALEAETRRILVPGRFRLVLAVWPAAGVLALPVSPAVAVARAAIAAADGTLAELPPGAVRLGPDPAEDPCLVFDAGLPPLAGRSAVIEVTAGYGGDGPALPAPLALAVRRLAAGFYEHRGDAPEGALPADVAALAAPWRRMRL